MLNARFFAETTDFPQSSVAEVTPRNCQDFMSIDLQDLRPQHVERARTRIGNIVSNDPLLTPRCGASRVTSFCEIAAGIAARPTRDPSAVPPRLLGERVVRCQRALRALDCFSDVLHQFTVPCGPSKPARHMGERNQVVEHDIERRQNKEHKDDKAREHEPHPTTASNRAQRLALLAMRFGVGRDVGMETINWRSIREIEVGARANRLVEHFRREHHAAARHQCERDDHAEDLGRFGLTGFCGIVGCSMTSRRSEC